MSKEGIPGLEPGDIVSSHELVTTSMGGLSGELPHGLLNETGARRSFRFRPPTMGTRKELGAVKVRKDLKSWPGKMTAYWLATALAELCGEAHGENIEDDALRVASLPAGDVLYMIMVWQHHTNPEGLPLVGYDCGRCGERFDNVLVDLSTMTTTRLPRDGDVFPDDHEREGEAMAPSNRTDPPLARVGLKHGFPFPDGQIVKTVLVKPPTWSDSFWRMSRAQYENSEMITAFTLKATICGVDTCARRGVTDNAIDNIWPADVALISEAAGRVTPTPDVQILVPCPKCKQENITTLDWMSADFLKV